jgi:HD-GYP domain-containing protein (c-di-GMP phosphodiesterase class II)/CheY-like chemotaxis protein
MHGKKIIESNRQKILLASGDSSWGQETTTGLSDHGFHCVHVKEGKECQLSLYRDKFSALLLDPDLQNHSGTEVLKFLKLNHPGLPVIMVFPNQHRFEDFRSLRNNLRRVGISKTFTRPVPLRTMVDFLHDLSPVNDWKNIKQRPTQLHEDKDEKILDKECTRIDIESFYSGNVAIFDFYIRLKENHFVKIVHQGEALDTQRIKKYSNEGVKFLYFKTQERRNYINFMNDVLKTSGQETTHGSQKVVLSQLKNISEKFMEEIHTRGLKPDLVEECKAISQNVQGIIKRSERLRLLLTEFSECLPEKYSHSFLVSFFASVICKQIEWVGPRTLESLTLAAHLHDLGLMKLPSHIRDKDPASLSPKDFELYKTHPRLGAEMLAQISEVSPQVSQILFQHHERMDGSGYPLGITGIRIFPLAKIVALADAFADILTTEKITPIEGLKKLLSDRKKLLEFDPIMVRSLVSAFIKEETS